MARLVTKFNYLKPSARRNVGGYAKYIATREGVEKIDVSQKYLPATTAQKKLIARILKDFPDSKKSLEYEDYLQSDTVGAASEFIFRAVENNADAMLGTKTYADYIALRPRAERFGSHGLITDDGVPVQLSKVSGELNTYTGNVYTAIISLRREDAVRLGFDHGARWRDLLRSQTQALADGLKIPLAHLRWYAAFHDEGHHPHVHLIAYSIEPREGHLSKQGVNSLRSSLAQDIFAQDLLCIYEEQTQQRDNLKQTGREVVAEIVEQIHHGGYSNPTVENLLMKLAMRLSKTAGKKQYGYLRPTVKRLVDEVIDELTKDDRISMLYDLWCQSREEILRFYNEGTNNRLPLSANREFRSMKNMVIQAALQLVQEEETHAAEGASSAAMQAVKENTFTNDGNDRGTNPATLQSLYTHTAALHLLRCLAQLLQSGIAFQNSDTPHADRKLRRKTQEKEQAHGLKHS